MLNEKELISVKNRFGIIGNNPSLNYALSVAAQVANTDLTVLIQGESGVGKEVFSQIIHTYSARKHAPFIAINCGAIPEGTIDSELFGHEKGSFTSASESRKGYFETVNGGTLFLDEIGEMPIGTQARLLRVLETGEYIRVGSSKVQKTNVRVIAATNKDLMQLVEVGKFREDLYYRLSTVPIRVVSLRERKEDIPLLFRKFCVDFAHKYNTAPIELTPDAIQMLTNYRWPGNIRELKNIAEQISVLAEQKEINSEIFQLFLPIHTTERMPALIASDNQNGGNSFANEREILYKLFFDMKKDVTELKKMFLEILKNPAIAENFSQSEILNNSSQDIVNYGNNLHTVVQKADTPYIISDAPKEPLHEVKAYDESLNLMEKEKEFIIKSLKKHKKKRRDAAKELGISERTLYRKIKDYNLEEY